MKLDIGKAIMEALEEQKAKDLDRIDPPLYWFATAAYPSTVPHPLAVRYGRESEWDWSVVDVQGMRNGSWRK